MKLFWYFLVVFGPFLYFLVHFFGIFSVTGPFRSDGSHLVTPTQLSDMSEDTDEEDEDENKVIL